jgi:hypothetical protein
LLIRSVPWPDEAAWKLRVEVCRAGAFRSAELWTFRSLPAPRAGKTVRHIKGTTRGGITLSVQSLHHYRPPGELVRKLIKPFPSAGVRLRTWGLSDDMRVSLIRATDDRGRVLATSRYGYRGEDGEHSFNYQLPADAKTLDLTFAVQKPRFVEFLAAPTRPDL